MGCICIGPIYIKRQSDSDNFLTFRYTLMVLLWPQITVTSCSLNSSSRGNRAALSASSPRFFFIRSSMVFFFSLFRLTLWAVFRIDGSAVEDIDINMTDEELHSCQQATMPLTHHVPGHLLPGDVLSGAGQLWHHQQALLPSPGVIPVYEGLDGDGEGCDIAGGPSQRVGGVRQEPLKGISGDAAVEDTRLGTQYTTSRTRRLRGRQ